MFRKHLKKLMQQCLGTKGASRKSLVLCEQSCIEAHHFAKNALLNNSTFQQYCPSTGNYKDFRYFSLYQEKSLCVEGKAKKTRLNVHDLRSLRWHCIKMQRASVTNTTALTQECFDEPLSLLHSHIQARTVLCTAEAICQQHS